MATVPKVPFTSVVVCTGSFLPVILISFPGTFAVQKSRTTFPITVAVDAAAVTRVCVCVVECVALRCRHETTTTNSGRKPAPCVRVPLLVWLTSRALAALFHQTFKPSAYSGLEEERG